MAEAPLSFSQDIQYFSISTPLGDDAVILQAITGEESLSGLFLYRLTLVSQDEGLSFDTVVGKAATVTIKVGSEQKERYINGIITRFVLTHNDTREKVAYYEAEMRPWLWLLTLSGDCRIYQAKTVPDIVTDICTKAGYTDIKQSLTATYAAREYCVQYGETDYNFVARLMEREGIFYYFDHTQSTHTLVLGDDASAFPTDAIVGTLNYWPEASYTTEDDNVETIRYERAVTTKSIGVNSFNFETPSLALHATADGTKGIGSRDFYTGNYLKSADGETYAKILQQAAAVSGEMIHGSGKLRSLAPGHKFTLAGHPRSALNQEYVVSGVRIEAGRNNYVASFGAFPSSVPYRPTGTAVQSRIHSSQTALVVGKAGEEIWVDQYGRVKVQFHWDRVGQSDENSSCWIRVAHNWAGKTYGMIFLPRIGQEVVVSFLEGDPDRPIITGSVYNGDQTVPYALPDNSTRSTIKSQSSKQGNGKFNEIRFEDKIGSEEVYFHAQKDLNGEVLNDATYTITHDYTETINHDSTSTVKNDRTATVSDGNDSLTVSTGTRSISVKGAETHTNSDAFTHNVTKDYTLKIDGDLSIEVTGAITIKGKSINMQSTSADITTKSATTSQFESGTAMTVKSGTDTTVQSGGALNAKSQMAMSLQSSMGMDLKASLAFNAQGLSTTMKGDASGEVSTSGILTLKGSMTKIN